MPPGESSTAVLLYLLAALLCTLLIIILYAPSTIISTVAYASSTPWRVVFCFCFAWMLYPLFRLTKILCVVVIRQVLKKKLSKLYDELHTTETYLVSHAPWNFHFLEQNRAAAKHASDLKTRVLRMDYDSTDWAYFSRATKIMRQIDECAVVVKNIRVSASIAIQNQTQRRYY
ncbi:hypothetical protein B0H14DRAFT_2737374 [Mycena olivaceomarginata]|nr:hypothetical protein B0H14DRAFT_2737374 [Mycena olivaceomarginata]